MGWGWDHTKIRTSRSYTALTAIADAFDAWITTATGVTRPAAPLTVDAVSDAVRQAAVAAENGLATHQAGRTLKYAYRAVHSDLDAALELIAQAKAEAGL
jgi:hypothetical protein